MLSLLFTIVVNHQPLPHVDLAKILEKEKPVVEKLIGPGVKQRKGPGFLFSVRGFDHFWLPGYGKEMNRVVCRIADPCTRDQALATLGITVGHASIRQVSLGNAPIATRRNCLELIGVSGLPADKVSGKPWKVEYEEDAILDPKRMSELKSRIEASTGPARIELIRKCYDWRAKVSIEQ